MASFGHGQRNSDLSAPTHGFKKKNHLAFLRQFSVERKLKSQLLFNLKCEDSGIH